MKIPLAGVIGSPIAHSKSPALHGHWLTQHGIPGYYCPMDVAPQDLQTVLRALPKAGFKGVNITIPHKESALALADSASPSAQRIGAANTLVFQQDGQIYADNTDAYGFITNLRSGALDWQPADGAAMVLGAGGAARAVIVALLDAGVPQIILANRTRSRADHLAQTFGPHLVVIDWDKVADHLSDIGLLVNTTSLGMTGKPPLSLDLTDLAPGAVVNDLVYAPLRTPLLEAAAAKGCVTVDGLGMLLHQGVPGFAAWFGVTPTVSEQTRRAVLA